MAAAAAPPSLAALLGTSTLPPLLDENDEPIANRVIQHGLPFLLWGVAAYVIISLFGLVYLSCTSEAAEKEEKAGGKKDKGDKGKDAKDSATEDAKEVTMLKARVQDLEKLLTSNNIKFEPLKKEEKKEKTEDKKDKNGAKDAGGENGDASEPEKAKDKEAKKPKEVKKFTLAGRLCNMLQNKSVKEEGQQNKDKATEPSDETTPIISLGKAAEEHLEEGLTEATREASEWVNRAERVWNDAEEQMKKTIMSSLKLTREPEHLRDLIKMHADPENFKKGA